MKNIYFSSHIDNCYEDSEIFIEIDKKCDNKKYIQKIKESYKKNGVDFIKKLRNTYEMHIYDKKNDILILIADLVGLKSTYYYLSDNSIYISDDIMELVKKYNIKKEINENVLPIYFKYHYISSPETIFKNIYKLKHGTYLVFQNGKAEIKTYWNFIEEYNNNKKNVIKSFVECKQELNKKINNYVKNIIKNKDNIGIYLSGGIDSSLVTALSMKYSKNPVNTFSIGFCEEEYNEANKAKKVANQLGTNHHELYINKKKALETVKKIPLYYSQPFADGSALPTIILNEFAKENNIKNVLTGDGADQLFCGSNIYDTIYKVHKLRKIINPFNIYLNPKIYKKKRKLFYIYSNSDKQFQEQVNVIYSEYLLQGLFEDSNSKKLKSELKIQSNDWQEKYMLLDFETYCCERVLTKMSVAAKRNNILIYSPFLDRDIIEYSLKIPHKFKYYKKIKKYILKEILYDYVPKELFSYKKKGFGIPYKQWLNTYFIDDLKRLSTKDFIDKQHLFNYNKVCNLIDNINNSDYTQIIWDYYIFQIWYEMNIL